MMVVLGELGGQDEYSLVDALKQGKVNKPVVAWVRGTCARLLKSDVQFGHAVSYNSFFFIDLREARAVVPTSFEAFEAVIKETCDKLVSSAYLVQHYEPAWIFL